MSLLRNRVPALGLLVALLFCSGAAALRAQPYISEFMASNTRTLADEDGTYSDWIELHNPDSAPVSLDGWHLTDSAGNLTRWKFPAVSIAPGGYLVVFASNKNRQQPGGELHTNFALANEGEFLALVMPDGATIASQFSPAYPAQTADRSYGVAGESRRAGYFATPTPGAANAASDGALTETVGFSRSSGPFAEPFTLELFGNGAGQHIRYVAVPQSAAGAAVPEPTASSPRYDGPIAVQGALLVRAAVFSDDLAASGPGSTVHFFQIETTGAGNLAAFSSELPVWVLEQHGYGGLTKEDGDQPAWLYGYVPRPAGEPTFAAAPDLAMPVVIAVRGSSSALFPKKSFNLDLVETSGKKVARSLLDLPASDEWALVGAWYYDPSHIRNAFMYALSNRIGRWAPRTRPVEVFLSTGGPLDETDHAGIYQLTDKVKIAPDRVDLTPMPANATNAAEITGGYLLKLDTPDANEFAWQTAHAEEYNTSSLVVVSSPKADKLSSAQRDYIRGYVQQMEDALHADQAGGWATRTYLDFIDRPSWIDHHILNTFASNPDAFERSAYFSKDRNGKLVAGPLWDFDRALGSSADERSWRWDLWYGENGVQVWHFGWWGVLATDPEFMQGWIDRWQSLRRGAMADANLTSLAGQLAAEIPAAAAKRDTDTFEDNLSPAGGTHAAEVAHLRNWIVQRARWIDGQFLAPPAVSSGGGTVTLVPVAGAQIVYTLDGSDPRALGGAIAPNALVSSSAVTVPAGTNVQARSHRPDEQAAFPGSPWSSAVGGPASTPLSPASRIVNLSIRGRAGSDENALIAGIVIADTAGKRHLLRAIGPGLAAFGATDFVTEPRLSIFSDAGVELLRNNGWTTAPNPAELARLAQLVGAFPLSETAKDSALASELPRGAYTMQMSAGNGEEGIGLVELYELDARGRTVNLSTRARVGSGQETLIGGFVVQGGAHKRMLIRAIGPGLAAFGVSDALSAPTLTLYSHESPVASNEDWAAGSGASAVAAAARAVGAFELSPASADAALLITVAPGPYTVEVKGREDARGLVLLEIYEVP